MRIHQSLSLALLFGSIVTASALAEEKPTHRVLAADKGRVVLVNAKGQVEWEYANKAECHDLARLPNGNVLLSIGPATLAEVNAAAIS